MYWLFFKSNSIFFKDDKKNGIWKTYSSNEVLYMMEVWDNGLLLKTENP